MFLKERLEEWLESHDKGPERAIRAVVYEGPFRLYYDPGKGSTTEVKGSWLGSSQGEINPGPAPLRYDGPSDKFATLAGKKAGADERKRWLKRNFHWLVWVDYGDQWGWKELRCPDSTPVQELKAVKSGARFDRASVEDEALAEIERGIEDAGTPDWHGGYLRRAFEIGSNEKVLFSYLYGLYKESPDKLAQVLFEVTAARYLQLDRALWRKMKEDKEFRPKMIGKILRK